MRAATWAWLAWLLYFAVVEGWAVYRRVYEDTLTYHAREAMAWHQWLAVLIPLALVGVALHFVYEYLRR